MAGFMISFTHDVKVEFETFVLVFGKPVTESYDDLQEWLRFLLTGGGHQADSEKA